MTQEPIAESDAGPERFPFTRPEGSDADMFIQWKGTEVCLDFRCPCGAHCHLDSGFAYFVECPRCGSVFEMGTQVIAKRTTEPAGEPRLMDPDEDMPTYFTTPAVCGKPRRYFPQQTCELSPDHDGDHEDETHIWTRDTTPASPKGASDE